METLSSDRFDGWKQIAAHVGKSVRTVQRWHHDLGLPVHRVGTGRGRSVFALRHELEQWLAEAPVIQNVDQTNGSLIARPHKRPRSLTSLRTSAATYLRWSVWLASLALACGVVFYVLSPARLFSGFSSCDGLEQAPTPSAPISWKLAGQRLATYDDAGREVWSYEFDTGLRTDYYAVAQDPARLTSFADLDRDGAPEFLFIALAIDPRSSALYCFDNHGKVRFVLHVYALSSVLVDRDFHSDLLPLSRYKLSRRRQVF